MKNSSNIKKFNKKLSLSKKTVAMLNKKETEGMKGGYSTTYCTCSYCTPQGGCTAYRSWQTTWFTNPNCC